MLKLIVQKMTDFPRRQDARLHAADFSYILFRLNVKMTIPSVAAVVLSIGMRIKDSTKISVNLLLSCLPPVSCDESALSIDKNFRRREKISPNTKMKSN